MTCTRRVGVSEHGSDALAAFAVGPEASDPVLGEVVSLALQRLLPFGLGRVDAERVEHAADRGGPADGELVVEDPYGIPACGVEPVLPVGIPAVQLVDQVL